MKSRTLAGAIALIFAVGWLAYAEVMLWALPTKTYSNLMDGFARLRPDDPSPSFTMTEVHTQAFGVIGYLQRRTPTAIPAIVALIVGFELLRPRRPRPDGRQ